MADKAVSELIEAERITATDLFVLEQNGTAKKLTGQILLNWLTAAADGHGGIQSITKLQATMGVQSLVDTYRITLADTTTFDFMVTNGRGVASIQKTATEDLVDTYTITYNDGTTDTFPVTNGAKGDKGDNTYVWIKYASTEPTEESHSFGSLPDDWIGIYFGSLAEAPFDWREYAWYQIKGEKGDTGAPATLISSSVMYQVGDSGSIVPSGTWSESVAVVPQGKYLWTRVVNQFNTGNPITSYSVSRMGMDGSGSVSSVAGVSPKSDGDVPLTASDVGALPSTGGGMTGELKMNGQPISGLNVPTSDTEAASKGYVDDRTTKQLIWLNDKPTSEFIEQDVSLDLSQFAYIEIEFAPLGISYRKTALCEVGSNCLLDAVAGSGTAGLAGSHVVAVWRNAKTSTKTKVEFSKAVRQYVDSSTASITDANNYVIPTKIYGIKGVSA